MKSRGYEIFGVIVDDINEVIISSICKWMRCNKLLLISSQVRWTEQILLSCNDGYIFACVCIFFLKRLKKEKKSPTEVFIWLKLFLLKRSAFPFRNEIRQFEILLKTFLFTQSWMSSNLYKKGFSYQCVNVNKERKNVFVKKKKKIEANKWSHERPNMGIEIATVIRNWNLVNTCSLSKHKVKLIILKKCSNLHVLIGHNYTCM